MDPGRYREFEGHAHAVQHELPLQAKMPDICYLPAMDPQVNVGCEQDYCINRYLNRLHALIDAERH